MILMITASSRAGDYSSALAAAISEQVEVAGTTKRALTLLRNDDYSAVVLDEAVVESEPEAIDVLLQHAGMAAPIYVNLAISSSQRLVREVKTTLRRHEEAQLVAMRAAESMLRTELRGAVTGILLSAELALRSSSLPHDVVDKMRSVCQLASDIRTRLETIQ